MPISNHKDTGVVALLFVAIFLNGIVFPLGGLYSFLFDVDYISIEDWAYSVCLNLICWQAWYYSLKNRFIHSTPIRLRDELLKFTFIANIDKWLLVKLGDAQMRKRLFPTLIWVFMFCNFLIPLLLKIILKIELVYPRWAITFIAVQLLTIFYFYLQQHFPEDIQENEDPLPNPWLIELIFLTIFRKKKF